MLNYKVTGQGSVVVLLHGFCEDLSLWNHIHDYLSGYTVVSVDLPGFGKSELLTEMTMNTMSDAVDELLQKLEIEKCVMIGHSLGGYVALDFAEKYATKLSGLGLFHSTVFEDSEEKKENRNKTFDFISKHGVANFANSFVGTLFYPENRGQFKSKIEELSEVVKNTSQEAVLQTTVAMRDRKSQEKTLKELKVPVLYLIGKEDQAVPLQKSLEQCYLPQNSVVHFYENVAHMGMFEERDKTNRAINNFISYCN